MKKNILQKIYNSTVFISGGTGSFGKTVVKELLFMKPKKIIIFSRDEKKQYDMRNEFDSSLLQFIIGDVRDIDSIEKAMIDVDYVFHAAAMKQVPTCEFFPLEAIKTNVLGTSNIINVAIKQGVKRVVALSTDKAVYPINVLGFSKSLMEKLIIVDSRKFTDTEKSHTSLCCVRYGNVLYTRGSVLPLFMDQIRQGRKLTITNAHMTRFLLPLSHAIDLVFYALSQGENGYTYIRKSPAATIGTLTDAFCHIMRYKKGFEEVGIRAGEKMHETLITQEELIRSIEERSYYKIPPESQGLDYDQYFFRGENADIENVKAYTSENTKRLNQKETVKMLLKVPEIVAMKSKS